MKRFTLAVLIVALLSLMLAVPVQAEKVYNEKIPVSMWVHNPCTGEWVLLEGNVHVSNSITEDGKGGYHYSGHHNYAGLKGTGYTDPINMIPTGNSYVATGTSNSNHNFKPPFPSEWTWEYSFRLIGKGKAANYTVHIIEHLTINANGDATADFSKIRVTCK